MANRLNSATSSCSAETRITQAILPSFWQASKTSSYVPSKKSGRILLSSAELVGGYVYRLDVDCRPSSPVAATATDLRLTAPVSSSRDVIQRRVAERGSGYACLSIRWFVLKLKGDVNSGIRRIPETKRRKPETRPIGRYKIENNIRVRERCALRSWRFSSIGRRKNGKHKPHNLRGQNFPAVLEAPVGPVDFGQRPGPHLVRSLASRLHAMLKLASATEPIGVS